MGEHKADVLLLTTLVEVLEAVHGRSIQGRYGTHTDDEDSGVLLRLHLGDKVCHSKEHGAGDLIDTNMVRDPLKLDVVIVLAVVVVDPTLDASLICKTLHKKNTC